MQTYKGNEVLLRQQSSTNAHEAQLLDARRQRKETDDQLQAMMNRIAFLAQEELRLDRDIELARRRAAEALARQATRDHEIAATAKDVLAVMPAAIPTRLRPHTGRSTLLASLSDGAPAAGAASSSPASSTAASLRTSLASPHGCATPSSTSAATSSRSLDAGAPHGPVSPRAPGSGSVVSSSGAGGGGGGAGGGAGGHPPRAPSASRGRPPVLAGRAADKLNRLPPVAPGVAGVSGLLRSPSPGMRPGSSSSRPGSASRPSTGGRSRTSSAGSAEGSPPRSAASGAAVRRSASDCTAAAATTTTTAAGNPALPLPPSSPSPAAALPHARPVGRTHGSPVNDPPPPLLSPGSGSGRPSGMQQLPGGGGSGGVGPHGGDDRDLYGDLSGAAGAVSGPNAMMVVHPAHAAAAVAELDGEVLEELRHRGEGRGPGASGAGGGLQEFATEAGGRRVVQVKASRRGEGATVAAAGVGWGMGGRGGGGAGAHIPSGTGKEARQLQAEMAKKQQIWKVRKTFGLEATPPSDRSAQVEEVGAGAWS